ncbi:hypothetical protein M8C21_018336, partial [Ambrosia artemisiifolia]
LFTQPSSSQNSHWSQFRLQSLTRLTFLPGYHKYSAHCLKRQGGGREAAVVAGDGVEWLWGRQGVSDGGGYGSHVEWLAGRWRSNHRLMLPSQLAATITTMAALNSGRMVCFRQKFQLATCFKAAVSAFSAGDLGESYSRRKMV